MPGTQPANSGRPSSAKGTFRMQAFPRNRLSLALATVVALAVPASAENGVSADTIVLGQATALEGPASALGQGMKMGLEAAFAEVNRAGGVKGRKIELKSMDDGYEPTKSIEAVKKLLEEDKVFAIAGPVGTPTSAATQPIANRGGRALYRSLYRRRVPARAPQAAGDEYSRQLFPGNRSHGRASDQRPRRVQNRDHVPGRCVWSGGTCRRQEGAGETPDGARRRRHI